MSHVDAVADILWEFPGSEVKEEGVVTLEEIDQAVRKFIKLTIHSFPDLSPRERATLAVNALAEIINGADEFPVRVRLMAREVFLCLDVMPPKEFVNTFDEFRHAP